MRPACAILTLLAAVVATEGASNAEPIGREALDALVKKVEANAEAWAQGGREDSAVEEQLNSITYDNETAPILVRHLSIARPSPNDLYVVNHLIKPLLRSDKDVIAQALAPIKRLQAGALPKPFPPMSNAVKSGQLPVYAEPVSADRLMDDLAELERSRDQKMRNDERVARYNTEAVELSLLTARLLLAADTRAYDANLVELVAKEEGLGRATWIDILAMIRSAAGEMDEARASHYYGSLAKLGSRMIAVRRDYVDFTKPELTDSQQSAYKAVKTDYPGVRYLETANAMAGKAGKPKLEVPPTAKIDERYKPR